MSKDKNKKVPEAEKSAPAPEAEIPCTEEVPEAPATETDSLPLLLAELDAARAELTDREDKYLRLAAEYDNYRKRTQKEKEAAWSDAKAETAAAFLPVYDNLERALKAPCADEAYVKGVEMTMTQLREVLSRLGIEEIPALGETFDPNLHNAVMHVDDESAGEGVIVDVFQTGFRSADKVVRFAMVKVAN